MLADAPFVAAIADYYRTDPISRASPTMAECSAVITVPALAAE
jgi:NADH-quinone oxidoreductase subunit G